jgi:5,10-methylenetetrahydromethanopterin reductase
MATSEPRATGLGLSLSNEDDARTTLGLCQRADELGFDEVSLPESRQHRAVFSMAAAAMVSTRRVRVRIGIANPVTRHPAVLAMEAGTLAELGGPERLAFGVAAAEWTMRALGYDPPGWRPYTHVVETLRALRRWLAGDELGFTPTTFPARPDTRLDFVPPPGIRLDVGAVNGRMIEAAGELADGVQLGALVSPGYARWARERLTAGAQRAGREPGELLVSSNVLVSVDPDRTAARRAVREVLAYYLSRVEGVVVDTSGADPENVAAVREAVRRDGVTAGARLVGDQVVDTFAAAGTEADVTTGLRRWVSAGIDLPLAWYTFGPDRDQALRTLAGPVRAALLA